MEKEISLYSPEIYSHPLNDFKSHFQNPQNKKILFSGRYGSGKTSFLKEFFPSLNNDATQTKYDVHHIFPCSYSISSNEDIYKYIKYDIICSFLSLQIDQEGYNFTVTETVPDFVTKNLDKIFLSTLKIIGKLGRYVPGNVGVAMMLLEPFRDCIDEGVSVLNAIKEHRKNINDSSSEAQLLSFLEETLKDSSSIYENDAITKLIEKTLNQRKGKGYAQVLVIDDLDRLDPEHIFRILNVFASQFGSEYSVAKFNFDKIIIVCDLDNIRSIFHNRYGADVDFAGYIDKFYDNHIYRFNNRPAVSQFLNKILKSLTFEPIGLLKDHQIFNKYFEDNFFKEIVQAFILQGGLTIRELRKIINTHIDYHKITIKLSNYQYVGWDHAPEIAQLRLLQDLFGSFTTFKKAVVKGRDVGIAIPYFKNWVGKLLYFLNRERHKYTIREFFCEFGAKTLKISLKQERNLEISVWEESMENGNQKYNPANFVSRDFWELLSEVLDQLHSEQVL